MTLAIKLASVICLILFIRNGNAKEGNSTTEEQNTDVQTLWIEQKLDNFNLSDERTWQMRYLSDDRFYVEGAPVFIRVGGEWEISTKGWNSTHMYDMAKQLHGYIFYTEHRYYGQSRPTSDLSNENIKYLDVRQALADLAHFIRTMKATIPGMAESKFILQGCSYGGTMVTWFKRLYPDLVAGCWASSGPLLYKLYFPEYREIVEKSIKLVGGSACYNRIKTAFAKMESMFHNGQGDKFKKSFKICNAFDERNEADVSNLFDQTSEIFSVIVQYHRNKTIQSVCEKIMQGEDDISGLVSYFSDVFAGKDPGSRAIDHSFSVIGNETCSNLTHAAQHDLIMNLTYTDRIERRWLYQSCNEFGNFQISSKETIQCRQAFGNKFTKEYISKQIDETNRFFGGLEPQVKNVYFTQGELDPWRAAGLQQGDQVTIIPMEAHCSDLGSISDSDSPEVRAVKHRIADLVQQWIQH